jgi:hypothetical protein
MSPILRFESNFMQVNMISDSGEITIRAARMEDVPILVDLSSQLNYLSTDS